MSILKVNKRFALSVVEFAMPAPQSGSIDIYSGFQAQTVGSELHKEIQAARIKHQPGYRAEVWFTHAFKLKKYTLDVSGRMDGLVKTDLVRVEEIKTAFDINKLQRMLTGNEYTHPYWLQLQTYGYIYWLKTDVLPELSLCLVSQRNKKELLLTMPFDIPRYELWLQQRIADITAEIHESVKRIKQRKKTAKKLIFPFAEPRSGQKELIDSVTEGMKNKSRMLIQAPTGLGKTMGILYPTLHEALTRGQKLIYVTPKNSQHLAAQLAIKKIQVNVENVSSLTVTAKQKLCFKAQQLCNSDYCEYAKDHYSKVEQHQILALVKLTNNVTADTLRELGQQFQVCPYELQMQVVTEMDTVICDYNYIFSSMGTNNRIGRLMIGEKEKPNLVIDEMHNLPSRSMEYYTMRISADDLQRAQMELMKNPIVLQEEMISLINECISLITSCCLPLMQQSHLIKAPYQFFKEQEARLKIFLAKYLASDVAISENDVVLSLCQNWLQFTAALALVTDDNTEFFTSYHTDKDAIKITCCDASKMIAACYDPYQQVVGFSATLKPFSYYSSLTGLQSAKLKTKEFVSSFPVENRKILIIPQVSSKFTDRERSYPRIIEIINKITAIKSGNYFVFLPSFEFLEKVLSQYQPTQGFNVLRQTPNMTALDVKHILHQLTQTFSPHLVFAVQGGIFSEGVDYPGEMIIGAFIVGPPLPMFDWEREQMKKYYEQEYAAGFDYAYIYPAMAKAVQAAGRVIRSETDKGLIILIDNRFLAPDYAKCMPVDWFSDNPAELVSTSILQDVRSFWEACAYTPGCGDLSVTGLAS